MEITDKTFEENSWMARKLSKEYAIKWKLDEDDVYQEASLVLLNCMKNYKEGNASLYAYFVKAWQRGFKRFVCKNRLISCPEFLFDTLNHANLDMLTYGYDERTKESILSNSASAKMNVEETMLFARRIFGTYSSDFIDELESDYTVVEDNYEFIEDSVAQSILKVIADIYGSKIAFVVAMRYGLLDGKEHTLEFIAEQIGWTKTRIGQIIKEMKGDCKNAKAQARRFRLIMQLHHVLRK